MLASEQVEEIICAVAAMNRQELIRQFNRWQGRFPVDFTPDFLNKTPVERLQHIFVALCLQNQHIPQSASAVA